MEAERLLNSISVGNVVPEDVQNYLGPLTSGSNENIEKYQHFSLRALKLLIQQLNKSKTQRDRRCFLELSDILITSIGTNAIVNQNITPFSFEKLLINLVNQAAKLFAIDSIMSCSMLVKERLTPLIDNQEASSLLKCLANVLWQITSIFEQNGGHQDWELLVHIRSLSLEMFCISCQNSPGNDPYDIGVNPGFVNQVDLVDKYSILVNVCLKKGNLDNAMNTIKAMFSFLPRTLLCTNETISFMVGYFVKTKRAMLKHNPTSDGLIYRSIKDISTSISNDVLACFLEEELTVYEDDINNDDNTIQWKLHVIEELLIIYKKSLSTLQHPYLLIKKASIYYDLGNEHQDQTPYQLVCEAIVLLEDSMKEEDEMCMMFDLLGHGYLWKAIILYSELISSHNKDDQLCSLNDNSVITALNISVTYWKKLCYYMKSHSTIALTHIKKYFRQFHSTCNHIRLCVSLCSILSLIPQAIWCIDVLMFLVKWNNGYKGISVPSLLVYKSHLLIIAYGEQFIDTEIESSLKQYTVKQEEDKQTCDQLECLLVLALLYCRRGKFSCCNQLLKEAISSSLLSKNTLDAHQLMASLASITSYYIEAQSHDLPLVTMETCLTRLMTMPSPICISCIKDSVCNCHCTGSDKPIKQTCQTELELSMDALNLTRGLSQIFANKYNKQRGRGGQSTMREDSSSSVDKDMSGNGVPGSMIVSLSCVDMWDNIIQTVSCLYRVSELFIGRESIKESLHYINEGMELARLMCLKYWYIKFLLLLSSVKDMSGSFVEGDRLRKEMESLLQPRTITEQERDLTEIFNKLTINPAINKSIINTFSDHLSTCVCVDCISPVRIVVVLEYLHQLIERRDYPNDLIKYSNQVLDYNWAKVCVAIIDDKEQLKQNKRKQKGASEKRFKTELILPLKITNTLLYIKGLLDQDGGQIAKAVKYSQKALDDLNPIIIPLLHIPVLRLRLAELHFVIGQATLLTTDSAIITDINERVTPIQLATIQSGINVQRDRARKVRHKRARKIIDSDEEEERKKDSRLQVIPSLPKSLVPFIAHFLLSYQLLSPTSLSLSLTKSLYNQLGLCLSIWQTTVAAHFILYSSYLSFSMDSVLWTWKKIRRCFRRNHKCHLSELVLKDITRTICPPPSCDTLPSDQLSINLMKSRAILRCLMYPIPLSYTRQLIDELPSEWLYCNISLVNKVGRNKEDTVIVIVRVSKGKDCILVKIPMEMNDKSKESEDVMKQFKTIMCNSTQSTVLTDKRKWWTIRRNLDSKMKEYLDILQDKLFGKWMVLLNSSSDPLSVSSLSRVISLLNECEVPSPELWAEILLRGTQAIDNKHSLVSIIQSLTYGNDSSYSSTIEKLYKELNKYSSSLTDNPPLSLILSLGHPLHELPVENMPLLRDHPVSRIPSLSFLIAHSITNRDYTDIDPRLTYYIINPSGDLKNTEKTFAKWFEREEGWEGVVGKPPTSAQFVYGFEKRRVVIYCGHGRAREYLKEGHIQELDCQATVLQMGCSSGKLQNVGDNLEPSGIVFNFLLAGCPSLVVNLWDVTDVDIDRFCSTLVKEWLSGVTKTDHYKLLQVVSEARDSCKLKYLVGASPVVYGLPILKH